MNRPRDDQPLRDAANFTAGAIVRRSTGDDTEYRSSTAVHDRRSKTSEKPNHHTRITAERAGVVRVFHQNEANPHSEAEYCRIDHECNIAVSEKPNDARALQDFFQQRGANA